MEDIILSLEPAFYRVERYILWQNGYKSFLAFLFGNGLFYAIARAGLRPFCALFVVLFGFHILDSLKQRRSQPLPNDENQYCELTKLILRSYRQVCQTHEQLLTLKNENRLKYSLLIMIVCAILAIVGLKFSGYYISYFIMLVLFTLPGIIYHKLIPKLLKRVAPVLEQFDRSMDIQRRSLLDPKDLLVKIDKSKLNGDDDDEDVRRLREQQQKTMFSSSDDDDDDDDDEDDDIVDHQQSDGMPDHFNSIERRESTSEMTAAAVVPKNDTSFDMLSDSSSTTEDEATRLNEIYQNMHLPSMDGRHRIKIKGDEIKIKGRPAKQRPKLMDAQFFDQDQQIQPTETPIIQNSVSIEPDMTSFDFLNDYEDPTK